MEGGPPLNEFPSAHAVKRSKFLWRVFLISNFALCAYMFALPGRREKAKEKSLAPAAVTSTTPAAVTPPPEEEPIISPPVPRPVIVRPPPPQDQQRELFQWMLEQKRLVKPQNREDEKCIDEDKAILKQFIHSESIPRI